MGIKWAIQTRSCAPSAPAARAERSLLRPGINSASGTTFTLALCTIRIERTNRIIHLPFTLVLALPSFSTKPCSSTTQFEPEVAVTHLYPLYKNQTQNYSITSYFKLFKASIKATSDPLTASSVLSQSPLTPRALTRQLSAPSAKISIFQRS